MSAPPRATTQISIETGNIFLEHQGMFFSFILVIEILRFLRYLEISKKNKRNFCFFLIIIKSVFIDVIQKSKKRSLFFQCAHSPFE